MKVDDLSGKKFNRLTAISRLPNRKYARSESTVWKCLCECGKEHEVLAQCLVGGNVKSCGCARYTKTKCKICGSQSVSREMELCKTHYRAEKRRILQSEWGYAGKSWETSTWRDAEILAEHILKSEGFEFIVPLNEISRISFWDIKAEKDGKVYVVAVTTRTHCRNLSRKLAWALKLNMLYLYVKPSLDKYILKESPELLYGDLEKLKGVV